MESTVLLKEYDITFDSEIIVNQDDQLADRVWAAAIDFLVTCGVYCQSTGRVILHTKEEIETYLKDAPSQVLLGRGTDACLEERARWKTRAYPSIWALPLVHRFLKNFLFQ